MFGMCAWLGFGTLFSWNGNYEKSSSSQFRGLRMNSDEKKIAIWNRAFERCRVIDGGLLTASLD
eukprot:5650691-Amphidinium_carterae.1